MTTNFIALMLRKFLNYRVWRHLFFLLHILAKRTQLSKLPTSKYFVNQYYIRLFIFMLNSNIIKLKTCIFILHTSYLS